MSMGDKPLDEATRPEPCVEDMVNLLLGEGRIPFSLWWGTLKRFFEPIPPLQWSALPVSSSWS